jgi:spermidine synthase
MWRTLFGRIIYQSPSGILVYQNLGYRWLTFGNEILQTLMNRRHPEYPALRYITPLVQMVLNRPGDCCILGLGGAGVAHALYPALNNSRIVAVDNSAEVIDIAARFFNTQRLPHFTMVHQSAANYVHASSAVYQHLVVDLHDAKDFPNECNHDAFFAHCKSRLLPGGVLAVNLLNVQNKKEVFQRIQTNFKDCTLTIPIQKTANTIIFAFNLLEPKDFLTTIQQAHFIQNLIWDPFWGYIGQVKSSDDHLQVSIE